MIFFAVLHGMVGWGESPFFFSAASDRPIKMVMIFVEYPLVN